MLFGGLGSGAGGWAISDDLREQEVMEDVCDFWRL